MCHAASAPLKSTRDLRLAKIKKFVLDRDLDSLTDFSG